VGPYGLQKPCHPHFWTGNCAVPIAPKLLYLGLCIVYWLTTLRALPIRLVPMQVPSLLLRQLSGALRHPETMPFALLDG
jgi:hypothetical protein